jgi:hypothetical protein
MTSIDLNKPKTVAEYEKFLNGRERKTLMRFQRFLDLISETRDIAPFDLYPDELFIEKIKFNRRTLLFGDAWNILYQLSENFLSVFPTQPIFQEGSKLNPRGLAIRYQRDEEPYATNLKNFQTAISNVYRGTGIFGSFFTVKEKAGALSRILTGLFRDDLFHKLDDQGGGEFYIDILDELLADDEEAGQLLGSRIENSEEFDKAFSRISKPYIEDITKKLSELEKDGWIKVKSIKSEVFKSGDMNIAVVNGAVMPAGKVLTFILVVKATKINWRKFIESVSEKCEKANLQWDNIFSDAKQKSLVINLINERRKELDRDDDIIVSLKSWNYNEDRIHTLRTLEGLERDGLITLGGFKIREPDTYDKLRGVPGSFALKAEISVTSKFKERIQEIADEDTKNLWINRNNLNQKQKKVKTVFSQKEKFKNASDENVKKDPMPEMIKIKSARMEGRILIINNGQETISFNSSNLGEHREEAEASKTFKVFNLLWADRFEMKDRIVTNKSGKMISAENLTHVGKVPTEGALKKLIVRLNARFMENGLKIKISGKGGKYKLSVNFE